jgi:hypothetical protein
MAAGMSIGGNIIVVKWPCALSDTSLSTEEIIHYPSSVSYRIHPRRYLLHQSFSMRQTLTKPLVIKLFFAKKDQIGSMRVQSFLDILCLEAQPQHAGVLLRKQPAYYESTRKSSLNCLFSGVNAWVGEGIVVSLVARGRLRK